MHARKLAVPVEPDTPNLIPMIDVMFLLLLFFMLGADRAARADAELCLARADRCEPLPRENDPAFPETVANVHHAAVPCPQYDAESCRDVSHWCASIGGRVRTHEELATELSQLAADAPDPARRALRPGGGERVLSRREVRIRADRQAAYGDVQRVIAACGAAGIYRLSLGAELPPTR
jgi:biopolymer transport protein ExbD